MALRVPHIAGGALLVLAGGLAYAATRAAGPVPMPAYTELREGPLQEHLVTAEELIGPPVYTAAMFPVRVGHEITSIITQGFAPLHCQPDAQAAALPAEGD